MRPVRACARRALDNPVHFITQPQPPSPHARAVSSPSPVQPGPLSLVSRVGAGRGGLALALPLCVKSTGLCIHIECLPRRQGDKKISPTFPIESQWPPPLRSQRGEVHRELHYVPRPSTRTVGGGGRHSSESLQTPRRHEGPCAMAVTLTPGGGIRSRAVFGSGIFL